MTKSQSPSEHRAILLVRYDRDGMSSTLSIWAAGVAYPLLSARINEMEVVRNVSFV